MAVSPLSSIFTEEVISNVLMPGKTLRAHRKYSSHKNESITIMTEGKIEGDMND